MKIKWFVAVAVCLLLALPTFAEEGINEIGKAWINAVKAGDIDTLTSLYAEDAVSYPPDAMVVKGREEIGKSWAQLFGMFDVVDIEAFDAHHVTCGDMSAAWGQFRFTLVPKGGGDQIVMEGRFADAAKKVNGKWLYTMDHASMPAASE